MRILNVNSTIDPVLGGGTAERTVEMCRHLLREKASCSLLTLARGVTEERREALRGVDLVALPDLNGRYGVPRVSLAKVSGVVARADIVHMMNHWTPINALVYWACRRRGVPYVVCPAGSLPIFGRSAAMKR